MSYEDEATVTLSLRAANTIVLPLKVRRDEGRVVEGSPQWQATKILEERIAEAYAARPTQPGDPS